MNIKIDKNKPKNKITEKEQTQLFYIQFNRNDPCVPIIVFWGQIQNQLPSLRSGENAQNLTTAKAIQKLLGPLNIHLNKLLQVNASTSSNHLFPTLF